MKSDASRTRSYTMQRRATSVAETRARIIEAAATLFVERWYDDVTLQMIAKHAGVSLSTLVRHFATKGALVNSLHDLPQLRVRDDARVGDIDDAVRKLVEEYEATGDAVIRALALEERVPELRPVLEQGRVGHRTWIERVLAPLLPAPLAERRPIVDDLVVILGAFSWKVWRREMNKGPAEVVRHMAALVRLRIRP